MSNQKKILADTLQCLEQLSNSNANTSCRTNLKGTVWMLKNHVGLISSILISIKDINQFIASNRKLESSWQKAAASVGISDISTLDELDTSTNRSGQNSYGRNESFKTDDGVHYARKPWSPASWCLRSRITERRYSCDAYEVSFEKRCRRVRARFRRRKSMSEETLDMAEEQVHQLNALRDSAAHHSNLTTPYVPLTYRRCRSAVSVAEVSLASELPNLSPRISRQHSMSSLTQNTGDWPETITGLLTGSQALVDRVLLLGALAETLDENQRKEVANCQSPLVGEVHKKKTYGLKTLSGGVSIPRPDKKWGGEDAFFVCDESDGFIGVADGVGEWGELGCNPRQFAEELMEGARLESMALKEETERRRQSGQTSVSFADERASGRAQRVLSAGFRSARSFGSSTALVAGMNPEGRNIGVANIGDSTCLVLRRESRRHRHFIAFRRTKEQQHFFNCPYQLAKVPKQEDLPGLASKGMHGLVRVLSNLNCRLESDTPDMADLYDIRVQEGDLLIVATDGAFDNLFDQEIASLVSLSISPHEASTLKNLEVVPHPNAFVPPEKDPKHGLATPPENVARAIAEAAFFRSLDPRARTPFARQSQKAGGFFAGGKMDDITCVAVWVV